MEDEAEVQKSLDHQQKSRRDPVKQAHGVSTQAGEQAIGEPAELQDGSLRSSRAGRHSLMQVGAPESQGSSWPETPPLSHKVTATATSIPTHSVPPVEEQGGKTKYERLNYPLTSEETAQMRSPKSGLGAASLCYGDSW